MTIRAIAGLLAFNIGVLGVGAGVLWGLRGWRWWTDFVRLAGVAYLLGVASSMILLSLELVVGVPINPATIVVSLGGLAVAGFAVGVWRGHRLPALRPPEWRLPRLSLFSAVLLAGIVVYFEALFRAARLSGVVGEWDGWAFWVPKAKAIYFFGRLEPELLALLPSQSPSYPPGLPVLHAATFHAMGSPDVVTLHVQYWFYAVGCAAALAGLLSLRVPQTILAPLLLLVLVAPSLLTRMTSTYADLPLGYLVAVAALLVILSIEERGGWKLAAATVLLSGAMLTKREGILFAMCVLLAAFAASWSHRRLQWPRLAVAGFVAFGLALPWRVWFIAHGLPTDAPDAGYLGALSHFERIWPSLKLVATTLFDPDLWLVLPVLAAVAIVAALLARAWTISIYAGAFSIAAVAGGTWVIWSNTSLPFTQEDSENPIVRLTGTTILVVATLIPLLLERAWSGRQRETPVSSRPVLLGPDAFVWRSLAAWAIVIAAATAYPGSALLGFSGSTLPGGLPHFPSPSDCLLEPVPGKKVRVVVGYTDSYRDARVLQTRAAAAGLAGAEVSRDGCGRLRVFVDDLETVNAQAAALARARFAHLQPTLELDPDD